MSLWTPLRWMEICPEGLQFRKNKGTRLTIVAPGESNRDLRTFRLSWPVFNKIILSFAHQFKKGPFLAVLKEREGSVWEITEDLKWKPCRGKSTKEFFMSAGFGEPVSLEVMPQIDKILEFVNLGKKSKLLWVINPLFDQPKGATNGWWQVKSVHLEVLKSRFRPPLIIITGFLGSGKTTLLNRIVEHKALMSYRFVAVIQNEWVMSL